MAGGFDFLHVKARQEHFSISDELREVQNDIKRYSDRIDEVRFKLARQLNNLIQEVERTLNDSEFEDFAEDGDINISGKKFLGVFKSLSEEEVLFCQKHDELVPMHNALLKNSRIAGKRVELLKYLANSGYSTNVNFQKEILNLTPSTVGLDKAERADAVGKLMGFLEDHSDEMPSFMREYVEVWVTENSAG